MICTPMCRGYSLHTGTAAIYRPTKDSGWV